MSEWKRRLRATILFAIFLGGISLLATYGGDVWVILGVFVGAFGLGVFLFALFFTKSEAG